jgi:hypothetical protein
MQASKRSCELGVYDRRDAVMKHMGSPCIAEQLYSSPAAQNHLATLLGVSLNLCKHTFTHTHTHNAHNTHTTHTAHSTHKHTQTHTNTHKHTHTHTHTHAHTHTHTHTHTHIGSGETWLAPPLSSVAGRTQQARPAKCRPGQSVLMLRMTKAAMTAVKNAMTKLSTPRP